MPKAKSKTTFYCKDCGNETAKWEGRCPSCNEWNTIVEEKQGASNKYGRHWTGSSSPPVELEKALSDETKRIYTGSEEVDRVLGGGAVPGSMILLAGDPGIGKSTLLLQIANHVSEMSSPTIYITGEESVAQLKLRSNRLQLSGKGLFVYQSTYLDEVIDKIDDITPNLVIVDSIQTLLSNEDNSTAGSVNQIRECTRILLEWAKTKDVPVIISGHVTKDGSIAGPRILEHMVDVVLHIEGDPINSWRLLRSIKNRFGSTNEIGVFDMTNEGLTDISDPSSVLISERGESNVGSIVISTIEGTRPLLLEVQALTNPSVLPIPRRVSTGIDNNRLLQICAVISRRTNIPISNQDIVVSVTGGFKLTEPAADLGIAIAIASSIKDISLSSQLMAIGEIALTGDIRRIPQLDRRIYEANRLGLYQSLVPNNGTHIKQIDKSQYGKGISTLNEAIKYALTSTRINN